MPNPTLGDKVDSILTGYSAGWIQEQSNFAFLKAFPVLPVERQSDAYYVWDQADLMRTDAKLRNPGEYAPLKSTRLSSDTYRAELYHISKAVDDTNKKNFGELDLNKAAARACLQDMMMRLEMNFAAKYMAASVWSTEWTGVNSGMTGDQFLRFNDAASTPITAFRSVIGAAEDKAGLPMTHAIMGRQVFDAIRNNAQVLDRIKYTQTGVVTEDVLAALLGLKKVIVSKASRNTANEGLAGAYSPIVGKSALVYHLDDEGIVSGQDRANAGTVFACNGILEGMNEYGVAMFTHRDSRAHSDFVEAWGAHDFKVTGATLGGFLATAVA
jgi:hypothetical protein